MLSPSNVAVPEALRLALAAATAGERLSTWAHLTVQGDRVRPDSWLDDRREALRHRLWSAGAPDADTAAIDAAMATPADAVGRASRFVVARDGVVVLSELLLGDRSGADSDGTGFVPDITPVMAAFGSGGLVGESASPAPGAGIVGPFGAPIVGAGAVPFDGTDLHSAVLALRLGRVGTLVLGPEGFGEQTMVALRGAPWLAEVGDLAMTGPDRLALVPTRAALLRAAVHDDVDVRFASAGVLPGALPVAYRLR